MRLIDADAVKRSIWREWLLSRTAEKKELCDILEKIIDRCCEHIDSAPTIDAVPVVNGHWVESDWYPPTCSVCNLAPPTPGYVEDMKFYERYFKYCPNCGAKMDEVSE